MDDREQLRHVEQELRDERARRREAEDRLEELTSRADLWRQRAEERTERINRMVEAESQKLPSRIWRMARNLVTPGGDGQGETSPTSALPNNEAVADIKTPSRIWPSIRSIMVVSAVSDPGIIRALSVFDVKSLPEARPNHLERADLVVIDPAVLTNLDATATDHLAAWAHQQGRQRLVVWTTGDDLSSIGDLLGPKDAVVAADAKVANQLGVEYLPGCFDPAEHHPNSGSLHDEPSTSGDWGGSLDSPTVSLIESAASGVGLSSYPGAGAAARRWAYRYHAPWVRASQLLSMVGLHAPDPTPRLAGVLVSHRPETVPEVARAILRQTHSCTELIVGLHGGSMTPEIEAVLSEAEIPAEVLLLDRSLNLGECLNAAISETSAPLLAKIDDDDHYGPAHLEDSFHAMTYSGAPIVGKGAQYTYLADRNSTVLRRPGQEEMFIDGSPNGATLVFRRSVWEEVGFPNRPRHVDTGFLRAARSVGAKVYAGSRWEFCYVRHSEGHTWDAEDSVFLAGAEPAWEGFHPERVEVPDVNAS